MQPIRSSVAAAFVLLASAMTAYGQDASAAPGAPGPKAPARGEDLGRVPGQPAEDGDITPPMPRSPRAADQATPRTSGQGTREPTDPAAKSEAGGPLGETAGSSTGSVGSTGD